jgi:hypothetical protein
MTILGGVGGGVGGGHISYWQTRIGISFIPEWSGHSIRNEGLSFCWEWNNSFHSSWNGMALSMLTGNTSFNFIELNFLAPLKMIFCFVHLI